MFFLAKTIFIDPAGTNKEDVQIIADKVMKLVHSYFSSAEQHPVLPQHEITSFSNMPEQGLSVEEILHQIKIILGNSMNPYHPKYIGHMDSIPTLMSVLATLISSSLNNNMLSHEMSPAFSEMEKQVIKEMALRFGYGQNAGGVMVSGGSLANLQALAAARNHVLKVKEKGLVSLKNKPVILASEVAHTSIQKAAMLLGMGTESVIAIKVDAKFEMCPDDLENAICNAYDEGQFPFAIVATAGTTVTGSIDPLEQLSSIAKKHNIWFHVDAAYGGALVFSKDFRQYLSGIENADSITFNPQKWLYIAKACAIVLFKEEKILHEDFQISAPYMNDSESINLGEISVQGTRHADVLKLWLSFQQIGVEGYEELIHSGMAKTQYFVHQIRRRPYLQLAAEPRLNVCCFRGRPEFISEERLDVWNTELQSFLLKHNIFFSLPVLGGGRWLRAVLLNPYTNEETIDEIFGKIDLFYLENKNLLTK
ncbi:pyridoxal phosphate-dependent decarboxylase family protein [Peribacillus glennii]|uniref:Aspartate aminotransferase family protein n=1 Tax=Peribacillus glennii TaxID=2303991 RepID=A0A372LKM7_9BACI|nr:aspartate aminotransferase family protein [Peribacillus glennii]RFU66651.1 aspartate aminotransferase family protein [Peribacillus glennii]